VNVALGTDSAASNNSLNVLAAAKLAALLAKGVSGDATAVPAATALAMATINGACAFGLDRVLFAVVLSGLWDCAVFRSQLLAELQSCLSCLPRL